MTSNPLESYKNVVLDTNIVSRMCHDESVPDSVNSLRKDLREFIFMSKSIYIQNSSISELLANEKIGDNFISTLGNEFSAELHENGLLPVRHEKMTDAISEFSLRKINSSLALSEVMALKVLQEMEKRIGFRFIDCSREEAVERFFIAFPFIQRYDTSKIALSINPYLFGSTKNKRFQIFVWFMIHGIGGSETGKFPLKKTKKIRNILNDFNILNFVIDNDYSVLLTGDKALSEKTNIFCTEFNSSSASVLVSGTEILD